MIQCMFSINFRIFMTLTFFNFNILSFFLAPFLRADDNNRFCHFCCQTEPMISLASFQNISRERERIHLVMKVKAVSAPDNCCPRP